MIIDVTFTDYMARKINIYLTSSSRESSSSNHHPPYLVRGNVLLLDRRPLVSISNRINFLIAILLSTCNSDYKTINYNFSIFNIC